MVAAAVADGFTHVAFGDLFLEDVRRYREERLAGTGLVPLFPLWGPTDCHAGARDDRGRPRAPGSRASIRASSRIDLAGREFDRRAARGLAPDVDPCGERGEFHTCVSPARCSRRGSVDVVAARCRTRRVRFRRPPARRARLSASNRPKATFWDSLSKVSGCHAESVLELMHRSVPIPSFILIFVLVLSAACGRRSATEAPAQAVAAVAVTVAPVRAEEQPVTIEATGAFEAEESSDVAPDSSGRVVATPVDVGQFVKEGAVLVRLQGVDAGLRLDEARAAVSRAEASLKLAESQNELAQTTAQRYASLLATGDVSSTVADQARTGAETSVQNVNTARATVAEARAQVALAEKAVADVAVVAPFSGFISQRRVSLGEYVQPSTAVVTLLKIDPLRLQLTIPGVQAGPGRASARRFGPRSTRTPSSRSRGGQRPSTRRSRRIALVPRRGARAQSRRAPQARACSRSRRSSRGAREGHAGAVARRDRGREHELVSRLRHRQGQSGAAARRAAHGARVRETARASSRACQEGGACRHVEPGGAL